VAAYHRWASSCKADSSMCLLKVVLSDCTAMLRCVSRRLCYFCSAAACLNCDTAQHRAAGVTGDACCCALSFYCSCEHTQHMTAHTVLLGCLLQPAAMGPLSQPSSVGRFYAQTSPLSTPAALPRAIAASKPPQLSPASPLGAGVLCLLLPLDASLSVSAR
jgi:hypothetical protein